MAWPGPELGREGRGVFPQFAYALALSLEWCWPSPSHPPAHLPIHLSICLRCLGMLVRGYQGGGLQGPAPRS